MEPLFFKAENSTAPPREEQGRKRFNGAAFFQSGKRLRQPALRQPKIWLQWSRFFSKRKTVWAVNVPTSQACFNGAAFFQSGKHLVGRYAGSASKASMEPLFFKAENKLNATLEFDEYELQWSRFFSKRKTRRDMVRF